MKINGLTLPFSFVQAIEKDELKERTKSSQMRSLQSELDAYGNHLETELGDFYEDLAALQEETNALVRDFPPDPDFAVYEEMFRDHPEFIAYIEDFSAIVCFGVDGGGAPFCFDFREDAVEPSVIWWADAYWRRLAPNFTAFIELFQPL